MVDGGRGVPWGLYVHIPFCPYKCAYCDFVAVRAGSRVTAWFAPYLQALRGEAQYWRARTSAAPATVFYGGGTPTALPVSDLVALHEYLVQLWDLPMDAEVTVECNPGTVGAADLRLLRSSGVNRLSIGLQAWQDPLLEGVGRHHSRQDFLSAFGAARDAGFSAIGVDLMYGLPGQSLSDVCESVRAVCDLHPEHISLYGLQVEGGTPLDAWLRRGQITLPGEDVEVSMYGTARQMLLEAGYEHYEISNFALPGHQCSHNRLYWENASYLGLGIGAASHWDGERWKNTSRLSLYCRAIQDRNEDWVVEREAPDEERARAEGAFLGLRLLEGIDLAAYRARYGVELDARCSAAVERFIGQGLLERAQGRLRLTEAGLLLSNRVFAAFV